MGKTAITRAPADDLALGQTLEAMPPPDMHLALEQHRRYEQALADAGYDILRLPPLSGHPDACFVEDTAVVTERGAVIARPGAASRRAEAEHTAAVLAERMEVARIEPPGTLDGGDVLRIEDHFYIGLSGRGNREGVARLGGFLRDMGFAWTAVPVMHGLHLKSSVSYLGGGVILCNKTYDQRADFKDFERIVLDWPEAHLVNTLRAGGRLLIPAGLSNDARRRIARVHDMVVELDMGEFRKMDGGLSCLSLLLE